MSDAASGETERAVEAYVLDAGREAIQSTREAAAAVAEPWPEGSTDDPDDIVGPLTRRLGERGVLEVAPGLLAGAADAAGVRLAARPVAGPPYVVVTSTGPVFRATTPVGRIVIEFRVFAVEPGPPARYRLLTGDARDVLEVALRE